MISGLTVVASIIGTATGFGISTIMVPVLSLWIPFGQVLLLVGIVHLANDLWKILLFRTGVRWRFIATFGLAGIAASFLGGWLSRFASDVPAKRLLGAFLLLYVIFLFVDRRWRLPQTRRTAVAGGISSGLVAGVFGMGGAVRSAFLLSFDLPKAVYLFTSGVLAFAIDVARISGYLSGGTWLSRLHWISVAAAVPVSLIGAWTAKRLVERIPQGGFRTFIAVFLLAIGIRLVVWG